MEREGEILSKKSKDKAGGNSVLIRRSTQRWFPLFVMPTFCCFVIGFIWPFLQGIYLSFCNFNTPKDAEWRGIENYVKAIKDPGFVNAFKNTALFAIVSIVVINVIAFAIAYALTQSRDGSCIHGRSVRCFK